MEIIQLGLCQVLLIIMLFYRSEGIKAGCDDWIPNGSEICCIKCSPGNRWVDQCGQDPTDLCTPCEPNTYTDLPLALICKRCTQCIDPQVQWKACNASADTVCRCKSGFICGNPECKYCVKECTKGEEPTDQWTCRKCPMGTFNDQNHSTCKPWRKSCPEGGQVIARGNEFKDITCSKIPETITTDYRPSTSKENYLKPKRDSKRKLKYNDIYIHYVARDIYLYLLIGCFAGSSAFMFIVILLLWFTFTRAKNKSRSISKQPNPDTPTQGELTVIMVEHEEACSFHQPEQEQGGSSESINTQDSETKLIL